MVLQREILLSRWFIIGDCTQKSWVSRSWGISSRYYCTQHKHETHYYCTQPMQWNTRENTPPVQVQWNTRGSNDVTDSHTIVTQCWKGSSISKVPLRSLMKPSGVMGGQFLGISNYLHSVSCLQRKAMKHKGEHSSLMIEVTAMAWVGNFGGSSMRMSKCDIKWELWEFQQTYEVHSEVFFFILRSHQWKFS